MIKFDKNFLISSIMTLVTVLFWISFDVYRTLTQTTIAKVTQEQMAPLDPKIKRQVIEEIKNNLYLSEEELNQVNVSREILPSPETETREATQAAISEEKSTR